MTKIHEAVNWTVFNKDYIEMFLNQMRQQFWLENEIPVSSDKNMWDEELTEAEKTTYKRVLGGLTLLDTKQGGEGMPLLSLQFDDPQIKTLINFMATMEDIHAKSYSHIFMTLCSKEETKEVFDWVKENPHLQTKANLITSNYYKLRGKPTKRELYMAMVSSVFLESFLFYSGFYYPLLFSGQGRMVSSGEIINLILRDESIHGVVIGVLAQELYQEFAEEEKVSVDGEVFSFLQQLYQNEVNYTKELYAALGEKTVEDVLVFIRYNANKALMNLGYDPMFEEEEVNPIVLNGLSTKTKQHDFFGVKGNGYVLATNVEDMTDGDFVFEGLPLYN